MASQHHANSKRRSYDVKSTKKATYHLGVKIQPKPKPKLSRKVVNKQFKTDEDLTTFILHEGTFKDRITAMALLSIRECSEEAARMLLRIASEDNGGDKSYLAITHAVKIVSYYQECLAETEPSKESVEFIEFIDKIRFVKEITIALSKQMSSSFLKSKIATLAASLVETNVLSVQIVNILMDHLDVTLDREIERVIKIICEKERLDLLQVVKDKLVQTIVYRRNMKKVKFAMTLVLSIHRKYWMPDAAAYKDSVVPLIRGYSQVLSTIYEEIDNPKTKNKNGLSGLASLLSGLLRFIKWEKALPPTALKESRVAKFFKECGYMIFKIAYYDNTKYSLPALNILEVINDMQPINYAKVLADTIKKYLYLNEFSKCEILNKAVNQKEPEVQDKVIKSAYITEIGGKYALGCAMVTQECTETFQARIGLLLLRKSYNPTVATAANDLLHLRPIPIFNPWQ
ncbi:hypothetical protein NEHOM01_0825 [Nematocida homosporus]|uniref:uncharacterized protein n=1 Tax=Nematocida homosporus TaxID=1912981 RepID=UPI00221F8A47|nr:uncharacterized protein NEHOM01_0825 [Nematocida homosporus]KAI5185410.1 hypothetical protein NEHOM01_0825 [Nematocida homosporus]